MNQMKQLQPYLYKLIKAEAKKLEDAHVAPAYVSKVIITNIIQSEVDFALQALKEDGLISESHNINRIPMYKPAERVK